MGLSDEVGQSIYLLAAILGAACSYQPCNQTIVFDQIIEDLEVRSSHDRIEVLDFAVKTQVGLVDSIVLDRVSVRHTDEVRQIHVEYTLENMLDHSLKHTQYIFLLDKRHLTVDLRKLRLTVSTEVLITEALHDLIVSVHTCHHKQLLHNLRRLGKRIK